MRFIWGVELRARSLCSAPPAAARSVRARFQLPQKASLGPSAARKADAKSPQSAFLVLFRRPPFFATAPPSPSIAFAFAFAFSGGGVAVREKYSCSATAKSAPTPNGSRGMRSPCRIWSQAFLNSVSSGIYSDVSRRRWSWQSHSQNKVVRVRRAVALPNGPCPQIVCSPNLVGEGYIRQSPAFRGHCRRHAFISSAASMLF